MPLLDAPRIDVYVVVLVGKPWSFTLLAPRTACMDLSSVGHAGFAATSLNSEDGVHHVVFSSRNHLVISNAPSDHPAVDLPHGLETRC